MVQIITDNNTPSIDVDVTPSQSASVSANTPATRSSSIGTQMLFGPKGETGNGIASFVKTSSSGLVDYYTLTFTDGTTVIVPITNGQDGTDGVDGVSPVVIIEQTSGGATISVTDASGTTTTEILNGVDGQDGANAEITGVTASVTNTVGTPSVEVTMGGTGQARTFNFAFSNLKGQKGDTGNTGATGQDGYSPTASVTQSGSVITISITDKNGTTTKTIDLSDYALLASLSTVATTGDYDDLDNKPSIPDAQIQSDWNQTNTSAKDYIKNKPTIPSGVVVDQTYGGTSANAQSGVAIAGAGFLTGITSGDVTTALGYTPVNPSSLSSVATSGSYNDLSNTPTIPTVNNKTITIQKNSTTVGSFTLNQSSNKTIDISVPTDTGDLTNGAGFITSSDLPTNHVTTNTAQTISARKTFTGEKAIYFKQTASTDKLGFTLYNSSDSELGAFEFRPTTIGSGALLNLNLQKGSNDYLGFRYWGSGTVNIVAPKPSTSGDYYIPLNFTDGNTTVTSNNTGTVNISTLLPTVPSNISAFNNDSGYITGITSSDVTTALGYTPCQTDLSNCSKPYVTLTYSSGKSWYRVWSDNWCEQGGYIASTTTDNNAVKVTFLKPFTNSDYTVSIGNCAISTVTQSSYVHRFGVLQSQSTTEMYIVVRSKTYQTGCYWRAEGYIS